ncbi:MAG: 50S ribosomal protein L13 [Planctomycetota bacterium]
MKTYLATAKDQAKREWLHADATDQVLGRVAAKVAMVLMGKHKPTYTPHIDMGDFVVVTNVDKIRLTGKKRDTKTYPYYTGYRGGLKAHTFEELIERDPGRVLRLAVKRMLPKTKLGRAMLGKLKAYGGSEHPHGAQQPKPLDLSK